jgi:hypothetical protein
MEPPRLCVGCSRGRNWNGQRGLTLPPDSLWSDDYADEATTFPYRSVSHAWLLSCIRAERRVQQLRQLRRHERRHSRWCRISRWSFARQFRAKRYGANAGANAWSVFHVPVQLGHTGHWHDGQSCSEWYRANVGTDPRTVHGSTIGAGVANQWLKPEYGTTREL